MVWFRIGMSFVFCWLDFAEPRRDIGLDELLADDIQKIIGTLDDPVSTASLQLVTLTESPEDAYGFHSICLRADDIVFAVAYHDTVLRRNVFARENMRY